MRHIVVRIMVVSWLTLTAAQAQPAFFHTLKIDRHARQTPAACTSSPTQLAQYLTAPYARDQDKARAIFSWIAYHISYDPKPPVAHVTRAALQAPQQVLERRKAVCQGYANLFRALCTKAGLEARVVSGLSRQTGFGGIGGHSWNAIYLDGAWKLLDVTWAAGSVDLEGRHLQTFRDAFFLMPPEKFVLQHLPYDPVWQLLFRPLSLEAFEKADFGPLEAKGPITFHYPDTLARMARLDPAAAAEASLQREVAFNPANREAQVNLTALQLRRAGHYATLAQEKLRDYLLLSQMGRLSQRVLRDQTSVLALLDRAQEHLEQMLLLYRHIRTDLPQFRETLQLNTDMARQNLAFISAEKEFIQKNFQVQLP
jgi:hypothetical protein